MLTSNRFNEFFLGVWLDVLHHNDPADADVLNRGVLAPGNEGNEFQLLPKDSSRILEYLERWLRLLLLLFFFLFLFLFFFLLVFIRVFLTATCSLLVDLISGLLIFFLLLLFLLLRVLSLDSLLSLSR